MNGHSQISPKNSVETAIRKPSLCFLGLPDYCFMRCKMCNIWKNKATPSTISLKQWESFFASLKNFVGSLKHVSIAGGETFLYKDIYALTKIISDFDFPVVITSNGFLINRLVAKKIAESNLKTLSLSLDGRNSQTHDYLRGKKQSFAKAVEAIRYLREFSSTLEIGILTIIMEKNADEIIPLVQWVQDNKDLSFIHFQAIMQSFGEASDENWFRKDYYSELWPQNIAKICGVLDTLIKLKGSGLSKVGNPIPQLESFKEYFINPSGFVRKEKVCNTIDYGIHINYRGQIQLCLYNEPIGDISGDIAEVYYSKKAEEVRKRIMACRKNCHFLINCNYED